MGYRPNRRGYGVQGRAVLEQGGFDMEHRAFAYVETSDNAARGYGPRNRYNARFIKGIMAFSPAPATQMRVGQVVNQQMMLTTDFAIVDLRDDIIFEGQTYRPVSLSTPSRFGGLYVTPMVLAQEGAADGAT